MSNSKSILQSSIYAVLNDLRSYIHLYGCICIIQAFFFSEDHLRESTSAHILGALLIRWHKKEGRKKEHSSFTIQPELDGHLENVVS